MPRKPDQAKIDKMMDVAEQLYGERGPAAVSLREIAATAGSRNVNAVQYHFGGVDEFITEILRKRLPEIEECRALILEEIGSSGGRHEVRDLLRALYFPLLTLANEQGELTHARLHLALLNHPRSYLWTKPLDDQQPAANEILRRLAPLLPLSEPIFFERLRLVTLMVLNALINRPAPLDERRFDLELIDNVLDMAAAALAAPAPPGHVNGKDGQ